MLSCFVSGKWGISVKVAGVSAYILIPSRRIFDGALGFAGFACNTRVAATFFFAALRAAIRAQAQIGIFEQTCTLKGYS